MISLTAQYAIRAVTHIARSERWCTADEISAAAKTPRGYMAKVLHLLAEARIIASQRGLNGGFHLNCDAKYVTAYDIVHAVEPTDSFGVNHVHHLDKPEDENADSRLISEIRFEIDQRLRRTAVSELVAAHVSTSTAAS